MGKYSYEMIDNKYLTPPALINGGLRLLSLLKGDAFVTHFDLDVCCSNKNVPAEHYFMFPEHDGLKEDWAPFNWCNPPFNECEKWVKKAYAEQQKGNTTIMLIPVRSETKYYHDYILYNKDVDIHWLRKGFKFLSAETKQEMGIFKNALAYIVFKGNNISFDKQNLLRAIKQRTLNMSSDKIIDLILEDQDDSVCLNVLTKLPLNDFSETDLEKILSL